MYAATMLLMYSSNVIGNGNTSIITKLFYPNHNSWQHVEELAPI